MTVREEWIKGGAYVGPRKTHDGPCCDSCIDDYNMGAIDPDETWCCCLELRAKPSDMQDRSDTAWTALARRRRKPS